MYVDLLPFVRLNAINWLWICEIIDYSELAIKNFDLKFINIRDINQY